MFFSPVRYELDAYGRPPSRVIQYLRACVLKEVSGEFKIRALRDGSIVSSTCKRVRFGKLEPCQPSFIPLFFEFPPFLTAIWLLGRL